jgi:zinc protease
VLAILRRSLAIALAVFGSPTQAGTFDAISRTLANGLHLVVIETRAAPVVVHSVWYRAGAAEDPPGKEGLAHLLEHLLLRADESDGLNAGRMTTHNGSALTAATGYDYTYVTRIVPVEALGEVMEQEAARITSFAPGAEAIESERSVIQEERLLRGAKLGQTLLLLASGALFGIDHPHGRASIGTERSVGNLTAADASAFHKLWHAPGNTVVIVVGDVSASEVIAAAERSYGQVPRRESPARLRPQPESASSPKVVIEEVSHGPGASARCWGAPSFSTAPHPRVYALLVLKEMLTARGASVYFDPDAVGATPFCFLTYAPVPKLGAMSDRLLGTILEEGAAQEAVSSAQQRLIARAALDRDDLVKVASTIGAGLVCGRTLSELENWDEHIRSVTASDVTEAARATFGQATYVDAGLWPKQGS